MARLDDAGSPAYPAPPAMDGAVPAALSSAAGLAPARRPGPAFESVAVSVPFFRSVLNGSLDCIEILRRDGTREFINDHGIGLLEIDDFAPLRGKPWASIWPDEAREKAKNAIDAALAGSHARFEAACPTARGNLKHWEVTVSPVPDAPGGAAGVEWMVSIARDVTGRVLAQRSLDAALHEGAALREALAAQQAAFDERIADAAGAFSAGEAERREAQAMSARADKMEAIGKLTGGVAHDFNNVLQVIGGNLQLAAQHAPMDEILMRRLASAHEAVERGAGLASQLLAFARRQPLEPVAIDIGRFVHTCEPTLRRVMGEAIELEAVIAGGLWNTFADRHRLQNVIVSLAINARDAMEGAGKLSIRVDNAQVDGGVHLGEDLADGQYVTIAMSDTGRGMTPGVLAHAFDPFFTTKSDGRGTGLGLSMAYGFLRQTGGHVRIDSEAGRGTKVTLYLPRTTDEEAQPEDTANEPVRGGTETILVVEDDPDVRATVVDMLAQLGYRVLKAADAQSALTVLESGAHIDLLFTDVVMPGPVRSIELARRAKEMMPAIGVLFTSGYTEGAIMHDGRLDPGVTLIGKPYRRDALARKVRSMFRGKAPSQADAPKALRVLIVEDDVNTREATRELLQLLGAQVTDAPNARAALALFRADAFDVLLTDVRMPGMSGIELAREARRVQPGLRVVFASGYGAGISSELGADMTGIALLPKPFDLDALEKAVFPPGARA
nr:response regulator [Paraburkholderia sp. BL8N3]